MATFHSNIKPMKELHQATLYRTQRLIRMGEWLERNMHTLTLAFEAMDSAHDQLIEHEEIDLPLDEVVDMVVSKQMSALQALMPLVREVNIGNVFEAEMGKDVTLHQPNACKEHRYQVVIEAPKPFEATAQQIADLPVAEDVPSMEGTMESFNNLMDLGQKIIDGGKNK